MTEPVAHELQQQYDAQPAELFYVLCIGMDHTRLIITGGARRVDGQETKSGLGSPSIGDDGFSVTVERQTLNLRASDRFKNRPAELWEMPAGQTSLTAG